MKKLLLVCIALPILFCCCNSSQKAGIDSDFIEMSAEVLGDKIRGGLVAQILGNLNGIPHENKYYETGGNVQQYTPSLPDGAYTDDDTDIEWVYIYSMQNNKTTMLSPDKITDLWKRYMNKNVWCSNKYARLLMDLNIKPPLTGNVHLNPWANFNISGQFICESFGLVAPAMPQTAAATGLNYTHVTIDAEPAQATQLFTSMIAAAFITDDIEKIIDAGAASIDKKSQLVQIVKDVRSWHKQYPGDWRKTRGLVKDKYAIHGDRTRNQNGYEVCTASTIAALLYGQGDLVKTLIAAFNFGWDADNNAATAATIIGVIKGYEWIEKQGWQIKDVYKNTSREGMPTDETITSLGDRLIDVAENVIIENGGSKLETNGEVIYRIKKQKPAIIEKLPDTDRQFTGLQKRYSPQITAGLKSKSTQKQAKAAYLAICLGLADKIRSENPEGWTNANQALYNYPELVKAMFNSPSDYGKRLRDKAIKAELKKPD